MNIGSDVSACVWLRKSWDMMELARIAKLLERILLIHACLDGEQPGRPITQEPFDCGVHGLAARGRMCVN